MSDKFRREIKDRDMILVHSDGSTISNPTPFAANSGVALVALLAVILLMLGLA